MKMSKCKARSELAERGRDAGIRAQRLIEMKIIFKKNQRVVIVTFDTVSNQFDSIYERNKFFRELYGWEQVVPSQGRKYRYRRSGLLDDIPHKKISDSVFMIAMENMKRMEGFFDQWRKKVEYDMIEVILKNEEMIKNLRNREENIGK